MSEENVEVVAEEKEEIKSFKALGLCDKLVEACESLGWKTPTKIQIEAIPHALEGKDLIGLAQMGSGKTGAFALPILQSLLDYHSKQEHKSSLVFFACVLSLTRELALQIAEQFEALGSGIGLKCAVQIALGKWPHIIVGTPGRVVDHLSNTKGEADRLLNEDFEKSLNDILDAIPHERRTYFLQP
ncbi:hypothetical protein SLE2022_293400 [Rubroshorea leprosula]